MVFSNPTISRAECTSTFENGSSSSNTLGSCRIARASDIRCRIPCEYCPTGRVNAGSSLTDSNRFAAAIVAGNPIQPGEVAQVLHPAHLVIEQRRMRHVADIAAGGARSFPEDRNCPARRVSESGEGPQQSRLPCPVIAEDRVEASAVKFGGHAAQRGKSPELLDDVADGDDGERAQIEA